MKKAGLWAGLMVLVFAATIFWQSLGMDYKGSLGLGPGFFPRWLSGCMIILTLAYLVSVIRDPNAITFAELLPKNQALREFLLIIGSVIVFVLLVEWTGFVIAGVVTLMMLLYRAYKWYISLAVAVAISVSIFMIFAKALTIPLPVNSWGW